jgi:hypothetical protein
LTGKELSKPVAILMAVLLREKSVKEKLTKKSISIQIRYLNFSFRTLIFQVNLCQIKEH